jgi:hypothetical protein
LFFSHYVVEGGHIGPESYLQPRQVTFQLGAPEREERWKDLEVGEEDQVINWIRRS